MDDQARAIGQRVRYWRLRRNLGRQRFADMVGRSTSWLDKVETGERLLLRLPMLDRVAAVLDIDASVLTDSSAAQHAAHCTVVKRYLPKLLADAQSFAFAASAAAG